MIPLWNKRFSLRPRSGTNFHRKPQGLSLESVFSIHDTRTIANDYTFCINSRKCQIDSHSVKPGLRGNKVLVETRLNGQVKALWFLLGLENCVRLMEDSPMSLVE